MMRARIKKAIETAKGTAIIQAKALDGSEFFVRWGDGSTGWVSKEEVQKFRNPIRMNGWEPWPICNIVKYA